MKKALNIIMVASLLAMFLVNCKEEKSLYDGPMLVHFNDSEGSFYVQDKAMTYEIYVGLPFIANKDITVGVAIDAQGTSAVEGVSFSIANKSVTIPAGQSYAKIEINGIYAGTSPTGDTLKLDISSVSDGEIADFKNSYVLMIYQYCPFNIDDLVGTYDFTSNAFEDTWTVDVQKVDDHTLRAMDLYETGYNIDIVLDDSDPSNFTATVAKQPAWTHSSYGVASVKGAGTFSACSQTITVNLAHTVSAGSFGSYDEIFVKQK
jgi:hypothetical protein